MIGKEIMKDVLLGFILAEKEDEEEKLDRGKK